MNRGISCFIFLLTFFLNLNSQEEEWNISSLSPLPINTVFNSIVEARVGSQKLVYSFSGVEDSLSPDNAHNRIFKYSVISNQWSEVNAILDTTNTLQRNALFFNNRIYLIGGYFFDENDEMTIDGRTIVYNPFIDTLELQGAPMPNPVRGAVCVKWRDSLIINIGGMNASGDYSTAVQLYDPFFNTWEQGESLPNNDFFKHVGAAGYVIKDTIYYFGGVSGTFVPESNGYFRKGVINPQNPADINWVFEEEIQLAKSFNAVCSGFIDKLFLFGGSRLGYDFNLEDTINGQSVVPRGEVLNYFLKSKETFSQFPNRTVNGVFGIAKIGGGNWISAGGIDSLGNITNRTILLNNKDFSSITQAIVPPFFQVSETQDSYIISTENIGRVRIYEISGKLVFNTFKGLSNLVIPKAGLPRNILLFVYDDESNVPVVQKRILIN